MIETSSPLADAMEGQVIMSDKRTVPSNVRSNEMTVKIMDKVGIRVYWLLFNRGCARVWLKFSMRASKSAMLVESGLYSRVGGSTSKEHFSFPDQLGNVFGSWDGILGGGGILDKPFDLGEALIVGIINRNEILGSEAVEESYI
jgi:hypothetical protein